MTRRQHAIKPECQTRRGGGKDGGSLSRHGHVPDSSSGADAERRRRLLHNETDTTHSRSPEWQRREEASPSVCVCVRRHRVGAV